MNANAPLVVSVLALIVSFVAVTWTIHRDVRRSRLRVTCAFAVLDPAGAGVETVVVEGVNMGPGTLYVNGAWLFFRRRFRRSKRAFLVPDWNLGQNSRLPATLDPGQTVHVFVKLTEEAWPKECPTDVAMVDTYGRRHFAKRKRVAALVRKFRARFPDARADEHAHAI